MSIVFKRIFFYLNYLITALQSTYTWQHIDPCDVLLIRSDGDCGYRFNGKAYAQIIDSFGELCINKNLSVRSVAIGNPIFIGNLAQFSPVSIERSLIRIHLLGKIRELFGGYTKGKEWIESQHTNLWCKIIKKARPKCIIGIQPDTFLCRAGKIQKIPVYDLQHGVNTKDNPYYGEVYCNSKPAEDLPDGFLCWDDDGAVPLLPWAPNKGIRILQVGNPWFVRFARNSPGDELVKTAICDKTITHNNQPTILVSLQWKMEEVSSGRVNNGVMVDALEKVILDTNKLFNWIVRLHPVQLNGVERKTALEYLEATFGSARTRDWLLASWIPLPVILKKSNLHITFSSAVVIEAAWMGIRSGLLDSHIGQEGKSKDWFSYERSIGMAEVIPQDSELINQWIVDTLAKGSGESTLKDYSKNLDAFIDEIAGRKS